MNAVFDFPHRCIRLGTWEQGELVTRQVIRFRCSHPGPVPTAAAMLDTPLLAGLRVRATQDMYLQPKEDCVLGPTVDTPMGGLHKTTVLALDPVITLLRTFADTSKANGFHCKKMFCTPRAVVIPQFVADR